MSRGDGLEIDSAISSTALSLHYLHFCEFWRYFIQFNYHSGSAREAISTSSPNAFHHLRLTRNLRRKLPSKQGRLNFLCCIRPYTSLLTSRLIRFSWLCYQDSISLVRGTPFSRWNERPHPKLPNLPNVSCLVFVRFRCLATFLCLLLDLQASFHRIFSPLNIRISPPLQLQKACSLFGCLAFHRATWGADTIRPDLLAAEVTVPIALTGVVRYSDVIFIEFSIYLRSMSSPFGPCALSCFLYFYTINTLKILNHKHPSTLSQHAFCARKTTEIETPLLPLPPKQPIASNGRKIWKRWSFVTNCLGLQFVQIALFVRMRSLDDCKVTVRSHKADFLSENER